MEEVKTALRSFYGVPFALYCCILPSFIYIRKTLISC